MKKSIETIRLYEEGEILARVIPVSDGIWMYGLFGKYCFETNISDRDMIDGIDGGRITHLTITATVYHNDNSYHTEIARYCGGWYMRSRDVSDLQAIDELVKILSKLPHRKAYITKQKQTA